jgi:hypothetical protein
MRSVLRYRTILTPSDGRTLVDRLLDEVLTEHHVTIPPTRRREFALALLQARLRSLEVGVKRTKGEIAGTSSE